MSNRNCIKIDWVRGLSEFLKSRLSRQDCRSWCGSFYSTMGTKGVRRGNPVSRMVGTDVVCINKRRVPDEKEESSGVPLTPQRTLSVDIHYPGPDSLL